MTRRHPIGDLPLPPIVDALVERLRLHREQGMDDWECAHRALKPMPDPDGLLTALAYGGEYVPGELGCSAHPFEVIPLFWNGGDGLHYGFAWYDDRLGLEHPPAVSYAPVDESAVWLGDTVVDGIRNLLAWYTHGQMLGSSLEDKYREKGLALGSFLELDVAVVPPLTRGARSERSVQPTVPPGWRFVPGCDGIGTLAPEDAFSTQDLGDLGWDAAALIDGGRRALDGDFPGTAMVAFRRAYRISDGDVSAALAMKDAYLALGRSPLAARVTAYLKYR